MAGNTQSIQSVESHQPTGAVSRWIDELATLLMAQRRKRSAWRALLLATPDGLDVYLPGKKGGPRRVGLLQTDGSEHFDRKSDRRQLSRLNRAPEHLVLRLSQDEIIEKTINVPAEAQDVIAAIVRNQIELISPWPVDKALYDWDITGRSTGSQLAVKVVVAGKAAVESRMALAKRHGLTPAIVDFGNDAGAMSDLNLLEQRSHQPARGRGLVKLLLLLLTIGSITVGGMGVIQLLARTEEMTWIAERHAAAVRRAAAARAVTGKASRLEARYRLASDEKYRRQPVVATLEALTRTLPDGTWLQRLEVHRDNLRIVGQSQDAASLIGLLEAAPFFQSVRFAAPVTPAAGGQQFVIEAKTTDNLDIMALLPPPAKQALPPVNSNDPAIRRGGEQ